MAMVSATKSCVDCACVDVYFSLKSDKVSYSGNNVDTGQFWVFQVCYFVVNISFAGHFVIGVCGSRCAVILLSLFIKLCPKMRVR